MPSIRLLSLLACCAIAAASAVSPTARAVTICSDGLGESLDAARSFKLDLDYQQSRFDALVASGDALDGTLAALLTTHDVVADHAARARLLDRATTQAPDDVRVQWIALVAARTLPDNAVPVEAIRDALTRLEPDNAAVWLETLNEAVGRGDASGADAALGRMAAAMRAEDHHADLVRATLEIGRRFPRQPEYLAILAQAGPVPEPWYYVEAVATSAAYVGAAYQSLLRTCRAPANTQPMRNNECAAIGRLFAAKGSTLIANRIGSALLRVSRSFTDADVRLAREQDWLIAQRASLGRTDAIDANELIAGVDDLIESGSEIAAYRRTVARAGLPVTPPDDWVDTQSPFSSERLHSDGVFAASAPPVQ